MHRREFIAALAAAGLFRPPAFAAAAFPVKFRKPSPWEKLIPFIDAGHDEFAGEMRAMEMERALTDAARNADPRITQCRHFVLPDDLVRYEIAAHRADGLEYRVGYRKRGEPAGETIAMSPQPLFQDVTADRFGETPSFGEQLSRGVPYWRARLDSACGIDIYGNNGIAVGDIDGDGRDEVYVCQPGGLPNRLYRVGPNGRMLDLTERAGVGLLDDTACALFLDLRNIGRQDLVVLRGSGPVLFLNQGDGTFALRTDAFRFAISPQGSFTGMAAADYDRDGRVDLYLCTYSYFQSEDQYRYPVPYHDAQNGPPNFLFRNGLKADGSGAFDDVTGECGINQNNNRYSFAPAWCDYEGSGWPSLYVANDFGRNNLYRNREGKFADVAREAGVEDLGPGMSAAWFDYDGDGRPDLYVANMWSEAGQRVARDPRFVPAQTEPEDYRRHTKGNSLFHNAGNGKFDETTEQQGVGMGRWAWSSDAHDFDNDGSPEILIACGMLTNTSERDLMSFFWRQVVAKSPVKFEAAPEYENGWNAINQFIREDLSWSGRQPNVFYVRREGKYVDHSGVSGLDVADDSRAFAVTDLDGDGNLDLILKSRLGPQVRVFENHCSKGKAIAFQLTGTESNRDAIGARVMVDGQVKFVNAGSGYLSQHTKTLHFGLGAKDVAERVQILWPSGKRQEFPNLQAGHRYEIREGAAEISRIAFIERKPSAASRAVISDNRPATVSTWLLEPVPLPEKRPGPGLLTIAASDLKDQEERAACYALFRRYLFDWRTPLELPLILLIDDLSRAHKIYATPPDAATVATDLKLMQKSDRRRFALPFPGDYVTNPRRNYFKLGAAFYWAGYPDQALQYLEEVIRQTAQNEKALSAIGQIHLDAGRAETARPFLERAVAANPRLAEAWNNLGGVELAANNPRAAIRHYERAAELRAKAAYIWINAGQAYLKLGDTASAEERFRRALAADPADPEAPNQLGLIAAQQGRTAEARDWFQKAITLRPDYAGAINNLGVLYLQMGKAGDAMAAFEYGISKAPREEVLYLNLGRTYVGQGDFERARGVMRRLLDARPDSSAARKALRDLENR